VPSRFIFPFAGSGVSHRGDAFFDLHREMNRLFEDASRGPTGGREIAGGQLLAGPRMDIHESENALEITAELPGVSQNDVDLRIEGDVVTIRGEKRNERRDKHAHIVERSYGTFQRSVQIPFSPDPAQVEANFDSGILTVVLPKKGQQEKAHRIEISGSKSGRKNIEGNVSPTPQKEPKEGKAGDKK
jgi:HSP20 family protein